LSLTGAHLDRPDDWDIGPVLAVKLLPSPKAAHRSWIDSALTRWIVAGLAWLAAFWDHQRTAGDGYVGKLFALGWVFCSTSVIHDVVPTTTGRFGHLLLATESARFVWAMARSRWLLVGASWLDAASSWLAAFWILLLTVAAIGRCWIRWEPLKEAVDGLGMRYWTWAGLLGSG
ncbi:hypothetical protein ACLOJK_014707, partial [Asimina triloba]